MVLKTAFHAIRDGWQPPFSRHHESFHRPVRRVSLGDPKNWSHAVAKWSIQSAHRLHAPDRGSAHPVSTNSRLQVIVSLTFFLS